MKYATYCPFIIERAWGGHVWKFLEKSFLGHQQNGNCHLKNLDQIRWGVTRILKLAMMKNIWQFPFCSWPRNEFSNFSQTWAPHAFSIVNGQYIAYLIWFYPYICTRSIIWIIWSILILSIVYSKSHAKSFLIKLWNIISWLTVIFRKSHFWNDLGKLSIRFHMIEYDV